MIAQDSTDSSANELLKGISSGNHDVLKNSKSKMPKILATISPTDMPFEKPMGWEWVRLGDIAEIERGGSPRPIDDFLTNDPDGLNWIKIGDTVKGSKFITSTREKIKKEGLVKTRMVYPGDFLLTNSMSFGRPYIITIEGCIHDGWLRIHPPSCLEKNYLYHLLSSPIVANFFLKAAAGAVVQNLNADKVRELPIPLPPLAEQSRIVAKVDELMALCDKLETQQHDREKLSDITAITVFESLSNAQSPVELLSAWNNLNAEANLLLNSESTIQALRKMILDLAVGGRLSYKEPDDGNAIDLVEQIQTSKKQLIANGLISRRKPVFAETMQYTVLPSHWTSLTLDEAISHIDAGWSPACLALPRRDENTWGILKTTSVQTLQFLPNENKELPNSLQPRPQYEVHDGDILITRAGPKNRVAICCVVQKTPTRLMISDKLIRFHIVNDLIDARYVALCLSAGESGRTLEKQKSGMADGQMNISQDKLRGIPIPLPTRAEQKRILTKVEGLMTICDRLSEQLKLKQSLHSRFAASSIAAITGIRTEKEEELKAPKTELISKLRLVNNPDIKEQAPLAANPGSASR